MNLDFKNLLVMTICLITDYVTGIILAGVFKKSPKSESGGLKSSVGYAGIIKKGMLYIVVGISICIDYLTHTDYTSTVTIFSIIVNEIISIIENLSDMGIPMPTVIKKMIGRLKDGTDKNNTVQ